MPSTLAAVSSATRRSSSRGSRARASCPPSSCSTASRRVGERCRRLGRKAVVIGGGDTAMDATRTAQRLTGASRDDRLPAHPARDARGRGGNRGRVGGRQPAGRTGDAGRVILDAGPGGSAGVRAQPAGRAGCGWAAHTGSHPGQRSSSIPTDAVIVAVGQLPDLVVPRRQRSDAPHERRHRRRPSHRPGRTRPGLRRRRRRGRAGQHHRGLRATVAAPPKRSAPAWASPLASRPPRPAVLSEQDILAVKRRARAQRGQRPNPCPPPASASTSSLSSRR